jgi:hypothetical protein
MTFYNNLFLKIENDVGRASSSCSSLSAREKFLKLKSNESTTSSSCLQYASSDATYDADWCAKFARLGSHRSALRAIDWHQQWVNQQITLALIHTPLLFAIEFNFLYH